MTAVYGYDYTGANYPKSPGNAQVAGYVTGSGGVPWTPDMWLEHPTAIRIDQSPVNTALDETADVLDFENGAATLADLVPWYKAALANYNSGARPGQRFPCIYMDRNNVTPVANAMIAGGVTLGPRLWIAAWGISASAAAAQVGTSMASTSDPFPVVGIQYANGVLYDLDVWSQEWLNAVSVAPAPPPPPPPPPAPKVLASVTLSFTDGSSQSWAA